mgnify:CR=1 FL=1
MKKITYQITVSDDEYLECNNQLEKLLLFPVKGNMVFKIEEVGGEDSRGIIVNGVMYDSWEDYRKVQSIKRKEQK